MVEKHPHLPDSRAKVANGSAITIEPVEGESETRQIVYENMSEVVNDVAVSVKEGFTNIGSWLEDTTEEMANYDYGG